MTGPAATSSSRLTAPRRAAELDDAATGRVDLLVVGLGATGAGVALDAATRGLSVVAVDAHDLAFGTSRWSSKLVHGGLRYLAHGQFGIARQSAVERGLLMTHTAPHLTQAMPMVIPLTPAVTRRQAAMAAYGMRAGNVLRVEARTPRDLLPPPRRMSAAETVLRVPTVHPGQRGGLLSFDGRLEDDARLVVALARTAAAYGARILTRARALDVTGDAATIRDELTGETCVVRARAVISATGVWAGQVDPALTLRPSRGTHVVLRGESLPGTQAAVFAPVPGSLSRFVFALPQPDGLVFVGVTDEPAEGRIPDVPASEPSEVDLLLSSISTALATPLTGADVVGAFTGLRPLIATDGRTADISRRHAVLTSETGVVTVVGGKLTTYRRMAEDAVDKVVADRRLGVGRCRTTELPLVGAAPRRELARVAAPPRLVRRYGTEAPTVLTEAERHCGSTPAELLEPIAPSVPVTRAELLWGVTHEGALDVDDLLDRRTRVGLVAPDRALAEPAARDALSTAGP